MTRVDLDVVEARSRVARELVNGPVPMAAIAALNESQADVPLLVAELRAAREVVEDGRAVAKAIGDLVRTTGNPNAATRVAYADAALDTAVAALHAHLAAYDEVVGS